MELRGSGITRTRTRTSIATGARTDKGTRTKKNKCKNCYRNTKKRKKNNRNIRLKRTRIIPGCTQ